MIKRLAYLFTVLMLGASVTQAELPEIAALEAAEAVLQALEDGKYQQAERMLRELLGEKKKTRGGSFLVVALVEEIAAMPRIRSEHKVQQHLNHWLRQSETNAWPLIIRAAIYRSNAMRLNVEDAQTGTRKRLKNFEKAEADLLRALRFEPEQVVALSQLLFLADPLKYSRKRFEEFFSIAIKVEPALVLPYRIRLAFLSEQGADSAELLRFARKSAVSAKESTALHILVPEAHWIISRQSSEGKSYLQQEAVWEEVSAAWNKLIVNFPTAAGYRAGYAEQAAAAGRIELARELLAEAVALDPKSFLAQSISAKFHMDHGQPEIALERFSAALALKPRAWLYKGRFRANSRLDNNKAAEVDLRKALELEPNNAELHYLLGRLLMFEMKEHEQAVIELKKAIELNPAVEQFHANLCYALLQLQLPDEAERSCSMALGLNPKNANAYHNRGRARTLLGRKREAKLDFRAAERLRRGTESIENAD